MKRAYIKKMTMSIGLFLVTTLMVTSVSSKMYRWTDKDGTVHYSQSIPPSQSQLGHSELNEKNGMTLVKVESSEKKKQRKRERQLEKEEKIRNQKALREELMVYMFSSRQELIDHFEERLKMMSVNIRLLEYHQKKLVNSIEEAKKTINKTKSEKRKKEIKDNLQEFQGALLDHTRAIESNLAERTEVSEQMARAIKTYDEKFGRTQLDVGSLIGESVLQEFRQKMGSPNPLKNAEGMCSCPCSAKKGGELEASTTPIPAILKGGLL